MSTRPKFLLQHILQYKASDGEVHEPSFQKRCKHSWCKKLLISCAQCPILMNFVEVFQFFDKRYIKTPPLSIWSVQILDLNLKLYGFPSPWLKRKKVRKIAKTEKIALLNLFPDRPDSTSGKTFAPGAGGMGFKLTETEKSPKNSKDRKNSTIKPVPGPAR